MGRGKLLLASLVSSVVWLSGCAVPDTPRLTVFAASSLVDPFTAIGEEFRNRYPGVELRFNFAGSTTLAAQIEQGAEADVFAAANREQLNRVSDQFDSPVANFAANDLVLAIPSSRGDQGWGINTLPTETKLVVCQEAVPCGAAAMPVLELLSPRLRPVSEESAVVDVVAKLTTGNADAGLVYRSDVIGSDGALVAVELPPAQHQLVSYPMQFQHNQAAQDFADLVQSPAGQRILAEAGFASL